VILLPIDFANVGLKVPEVLLPAAQVDLEKWAVVACDQYTSQPEYWVKVAGLVGEAPSTLKITFPEAYLGKGNEAERIEKIQETMREYLERKLLISQGEGFIYVERKTAHAPLRKGLIVAIDLECYDYHKGSKTLIRATEGTVLERIPPRVKIREGAPLELPHIMVLIDDPGHEVIEPVAAKPEQLSMVYQTDLMMNGGRVTGYRVDNPETVAGIYQGLHKLADKTYYNQKYGLDIQDVLLFAVGDGNHSLATAKAVWENFKKQAAGTADLADHPARYALVELVNVHDPGLRFEPIHRVLFHLATNKLFAEMGNYYRSVESGFGFEMCIDFNSMNTKLKKMRSENKDSHFIGFVNQNGFGIVTVKKPKSNLEVGTLQAFLDHLAEVNPGILVDYIHGDTVVSKLGQRSGNTGFFLPPMDKGALFKTVILDGVLPRKTFSMGEAEEKRFYLECRKIV
jgi:uncharacterized protein (DUF1015 family)